MKETLIGLLKPVLELLEIIKGFLTDLLKPFAVVCYNAVVAVPLPLVRLFFLGMLAVLAFWMVTLPVQRPKDENGVPQGSWLSDLRVMGIALLLAQALFYIFL